MWCTPMWIAMCILCMQVFARVTAKKRVFVEGDIMIGALFPVHFKPDTDNVVEVKKCGKIWEQYGIQRVEAFLLILDQINNSSVLLPNVDLGCDIRDSCWYTPKALEECKDFIRNSLLQQLEPKNDCQEDSSLPKPIAGLIGPGSSSVTEDVQNMLSLFQIPEVGYSATSITLSNSELYPTFLRVVSPDSQQARALAEFVNTFNWKYVSLIHTEGTYGSKGKQQVRARLEELGVCVAADESVDESLVDELTNLQLDQIVSVVMDTKAKIIVCFCEGQTVTRLLASLKKKEAHEQYTVIGSDGWNTRQDVVSNQHDAAIGSFSVQLASPPLEGFNEHYLSIDPNNHTINPWFKEFWEERFNCTFAEKTCSGNEKLSNNYMVDGKLGFVADALYTMAHALHNMINKLCPKTLTLCEAMSPINGTLLYEYLLDVNFTTYSGKQLYFDKRGDPPGKYQFMNYQQFPNGSYGYVEVATWANNKLDVTAKIQWKGFADKEPPSICSAECKRGYAKRHQPGASICCWLCEKCPSDAIIVNETCSLCQKGWWPNENLTACVFITVEYPSWNDFNVWFPFTIALIGIVLAILTIWVFIKHHNTAVVKASTPDLSYTILVGIILAYISTITFILKPTVTVCCLSRILPGLSYSLIYGSVLTNTNRIARILARGKKIIIKKPRCVTTNSLLAITFLLVLIEIGIIVAIIAWHTPNTQVVHPTSNTARLQCEGNIYTLLGPFILNFILVILCTFYAVKTRNVPANFNEAKFIGFTMYVTCVIWIAFVPIYYGSDNKIITITMCISLSATVPMVLLFWPKVYIILRHPERNHRGAFTTAKDIRCHVGRSPEYPFKRLEKKRMLKAADSLDHSVVTCMESFADSVVVPHRSVSQHSYINNSSYRPGVKAACRSVACQADLNGRSSVKRQTSTRSRRSKTDISSEGSCSSHGRRRFELEGDLTDLEEPDFEADYDDELEDEIGERLSVTPNCNHHSQFEMQQNLCTDNDTFLQNQWPQPIATETGSELSVVSIANNQKPDKKKLNIWSIIRTPFFLNKLRRANRIPDQVDIPPDNCSPEAPSYTSDPSFSSDDDEFNSSVCVHRFDELTQEVVDLKEKLCSCGIELELDESKTSDL